MQHHFLVVYDRRRGKILRRAAFTDSSRALTARFDAEREFKGQQDIEVVVLGAESWESLAGTHSRYFKAPSELAEAALDRLGAAS